MNGWQQRTRHALHQVETASVFIFWLFMRLIGRTRQEDVQAPVQFAVSENELKHAEPQGDEKMSEERSEPEITVDGVTIELPSPSIWPLAVGLGVALALFGIATGYLFSIAGLVLLAIGLGGWIGSLKNE